MTTFILALLFSFVSSLIVSQNIRILSPEEMQADFIQFRKILEENQVNLYDYTPKEEIDRLFEHQYARITDSMPMNEFFKLMTPIIAKTGNGHTNIWMPGEYWRSGNDKFFPVQIRFVENMVVADGSYTETEQLPRGCIIHKVNNVPVKNITDEMIDNYYSEGMRIHGKIVMVDRRFPMMAKRNLAQENYDIHKKERCKGKKENNQNTGTGY